MISSSIPAAEWKLVAESPAGRGWINDLLILPDKPGVFYAATEGAGLLISEDSGKTWVPKNEGLTEAAEGTVSGYHVRCIAVVPNNTKIMFVGMAAFGVFKSVDGGENWEPANNLLGDTFTKVMGIHPKKPDTVYLGTDGGGMYRRKVDVDEWEEIIEGLRNTYIKAMAMNPKNADIIYVGSNSGVSKTTNGGDSWVSVSNGLTSRYILALGIDPKNTNVLYAGCDGGGLCKSEDGGENWVGIGGDVWMTKSTADEFAVPGEEPLPVLLVSSVAVNPYNSAIVYAANPSGVFRSSDGGQNWEQINAGLTNTEIKCLTVAPKEPVTVYVGTADGKLFSYTEE
jgi:photosystem II stability/assembly factor-like uncharacterized protein